MGEHPPGARLARLAALALAASFACEPAPKPDCPAPCEPGSTCVEGQCVADAPVATPVPDDGKKKKKRRKKKRVRRTTAGSTAAGGAAPAPAADDEIGEVEEAEPAADKLPPFVPVDDRKIPQFSNDKAQTIDLEAGSERPSERVLDQHFAKITPKITDCVITASRYGDVGSGRLAIQLRLQPSGKVESVSVKAPASLNVWGIVPCARKAVYDHRFPSYDGPSVGVDFAVDVD
ncbi:hypothetical protein SAMN02745121_03625 [Nannocystis exedens]|uniref:Uncharacterized protein n=1 Tax=Nannocystis exedens TaxID=54 RepID=A0A1I1Z408_9BACT|nr:hypothetical protein [Nannocystis exedens]PCC75167.1 hypothetical protein NAEX_08273 [Nannocystis exedens]SFE26584.1 hypothetical protein SAMN02745121_03625 [Nannocystis exedens]